MKLIVFTLAMLCLPFKGLVSMQRLPISWECRITPNNIVIIATVNDGWHLYTQDLQAIGNSTIFKLNGKTVRFECKDSVYVDSVKIGDVFLGLNKYYTGRVVFTHKVESLLSLSADYQLCDDHECLQPQTKILW